MKSVICAPDTFKGTLAAVDAAAAMARGVEAARAGARAVGCPVADGGEGTLEVLTAARGGERRAVQVIGPRGKPIMADWVMLDDRHTAIVELARTSGLTLVPPEARDPTTTTTFGTGQLIRAALDAGCLRIIVGIGGSATCDGGTGIAQALGGVFINHEGRRISVPMTGAHLRHVKKVTRPTIRAQIDVLCDVTNPLLGDYGTAAAYGPQKGATPEQVEHLERGLDHLAKIVPGSPHTPGAGASGGAGFGMAALCGATLHRGIDFILDELKFKQHCRDAALVITGEGRLDEQTQHGKACAGVAKMAAQHGVPVVAVAGSVAAPLESLLRERGGLFDEIISLTEHFGRARAMEEPAALLTKVCTQLVRRRCGN